MFRLNRPDFPLKNLLLAGLFCLMALTLAQAVMTLSEGFSLGRLSRALVPPLICLGLYVGVLVSGPLAISIPSLRPAIGFRAMGGLLIVGLLMAYFTAQWGGLGVMYFPLLLVVLTSLCLSLLLTITRDDLLGLTVFFLTLPFLQFLEWDLRYVFQFSRVTFGGSLQEYLILSPSILSLWLFVGVFVYRRLVVGRSHWPKITLDWWVLAFILLYFVSTLVSQEPGVSLVLFWQFLTFGILFYILTKQAVRLPQDVKTLFYTLVGYGCWRECIGYYFYLQSKDSQAISLTQILGEADYRILSTWILSRLAVCLLPPVLTLLQLIRDRVQRFVLIVLSVFILGVLLTLKERAPILALAMTFPIFMNYRRNKRYLVGGLIFAIVIFLVFPSLWTTHILDRFSGWTSLQTVLDSQAMRIDGLQATVGMMRDQPLLGIGPGMWGHFIPNYSQKLLFWRTSGQGPMYIAFVHSMFLYYGVASGIITMLVLLIITGLVFWKGISLWRSAKDHLFRSLVTGALWWFAIYVISGVVGEGYFEYNYGFEFGAMFWIPVGLLAALGRMNNNIQGGRVVAKPR